MWAFWSQNGSLVSFFAKIGYLYKIFRVFFLLPKIKNP
nr:MAG TPA: hypothetical protein [Caudoviricetes sp.]